MAKASLNDWFDQIASHLFGVSLLIIATMLISMIRPRYLRIAPGRIQVLEYALWRRIPTIRDYPIACGTVILFRPFSRWALSLANGAYSDNFSFAESNDEEFSDLLRRAIFTTVPAPPLSESELVG